jgi:hypothetical protein
MPAQVKTIFSKRSAMDTSLTLLADHGDMDHGDMDGVLAWALG